VRRPTKRFTSPYGAISNERGNLRLTLEHVEQSLLTDVSNLKARALKASVLRRTGRSEQAQVVIDDTLTIDRLDFRTLAGRFLLSREKKDLRAYISALEGDVQTLLDVCFDLAWSGLRDDGYALLHACSQEGSFDHPMVWYTLSWLAASADQQLEASQFATLAEATSPLYCFPARLEEMIVLEDFVHRNPSSAKAHYYLGNLYYDKRRYEDAIRCWRQSVELDGAFSIPWRNLGIAEFNILHNPEAADMMYERAFAVNRTDARVLYEWDQLKKRVGLALPKDRLHSLEKNKQLVARRDDLTVEYVTLLNQCGQWQAALDLLSTRRFSPWEGGEGLVSAQYVSAHRALGKTALAAGDPAGALRHFETARRYPENLGEGKHLLTLERDLDYFSGLAAEQLGDTQLAASYWRAASAPLPSTNIHSYFRALSLRELGEEQAARAVLSCLAKYAAGRMEVEPKIDYFATSLPNMLLFDDDLGKRNRVESRLLSALACHGLGDAEQAIQQLEWVVAEDPNDLFVVETLGLIKQEGRPANKGVEVYPTS
jgi:tetratricopeptide (TPR) repeat protein